MTIFLPVLFYSPTSPKINTIRFFILSYSYSLSACVVVVIARSKVFKVLPIMQFFMAFVAKCNQIAIVIVPCLTSIYITDMMNFLLRFFSFA